MAKSNATENDVLKYIFHKTAFSWDETGNGGPVTSLYVSLHTDNPGEVGTQLSNEATYTGYARVGVSRSSTGWTMSDNSVANTSVINFGMCTGGSETLTWVAIGTKATGAGQILYSGVLTNSIPVSANVTPSFAAGTLTITED